MTENYSLLYSEAITSFTRRLMQHARSILNSEMHLKVRTKTFIFKGYLYPINIVCFDHSRYLGEFNSELYEIAIHRSLMLDEAVAIDVLKHELAHYITYLEFGKMDHGKEFKAVCARYGFPEEIAKASTKNHPKLDSLIHIESKIKKLLSLSTNSSIHEAESALLKAEELMSKYQISSLSGTEETYVLKRVLPSKRSSSKLKAIAQILKHFNVEVIFHQGRSLMFLELIGREEHVEIAAYVADFLQAKLEELWKHAKEEHTLSGKSEKGSFFLGLARGYDDQKRQPSKERGLIQANLMRAVSLVYPHLSSQRSSAAFDAKSHALGRKAGRDLNISPGIGKSSPLYLT